MSNQSTYLSLTPAADLEEHRVARLTRAEHEGRPACTCTSWERGRYGCHCPAAHVETEDVTSPGDALDAALFALLGARRVLGVV